MVSIFYAMQHRILNQAMYTTQSLVLHGIIEETAL